MDEKIENIFTKATKSTTGCPSCSSAIRDKAAIINGTATGSIAYTTIDFKLKGK